MQQLRSQYRRAGLLDRFRGARARGRRADRRGARAQPQPAAPASTTSRCATSAARRSPCSAARAIASRGTCWTIRRSPDRRKERACRRNNPGRVSSSPSKPRAATSSRRCSSRACRRRCAHAYEQRAALPRGVRSRTGVHPTICRTLADLARFPFTVKTDLRDNYPFGMFAVPREQVVRIHASSGTTGKPTVVGYTRNDIDMWATVMARSIRAAGRTAGRHRAHRVRLRPFHRRARRALRRGEARLHGDPHVRRPDGEAGPAHRRLQARHHHGHAVVHAGDRRGDGAAGHRSACVVAVASASSAPSRGRRRCARPSRSKLAIDAIDIYGLSEVIGPGVAQECIETKDGLTDLGGPLLSRGDRPCDRRGAAGGREGRARVHVAHQGGAADHPLSHARPDAAAAADGTLDAPDGEDHRSLRRHDDHPRRQRVPDADRGADPAPARARAALPARDHAAAAVSTS